MRYVRKRLTAAICAVLTAVTLISCGTDIPGGDVSDSITAAETEGGGYKLSQRSQEIFNDSYKSLCDRIEPDGYAATSVNGAYTGMFVRDAAIQVMAHVEMGDLDMAYSLLRFMTSYHINNNARHTTHVMRHLEPTEVIYTVNPDAGSTVSQLNPETPLYIIGRPDHAAAQLIKTDGELKISGIAINLSTAASAGELVVTLRTGTKPTGDVLAEARLAFTGGNSGWVEPMFASPVTLDEDSEYIFTVEATEETNATAVAMGILNSGSAGSYNYDKPTLGGWQKTTNTLAFKLIETDGGSSLSDEATDAIDFGGNKSCSLQLGFDDKHPTSAAFVISKAGSVSDTSKLTATLYKGDTVIDEATVSATDVGSDKTEVSVIFRLPLFLPQGGEYKITLSSEDTGYKVYGVGTKPAFRIGCSDIKPFSEKIQVDGNYMFIKAFTLFADAAADKYGDFIDTVLPYTIEYAEFYLTDSYLSEDGLLENPSYEHSREGRYWHSYDLMTNCFAAEALDELSRICGERGDTATMKDLKEYADSITDAINTSLVYQFKGKTIYTELIDIDNGGKVCPGFSFVSLAPVASGWYGVNQEIMKNTYDCYFEYCADSYDGYMMLPVVATLDDSDEVIALGDHVVGKGLAWDIRYAASIGDTARLDEIMNFIEARTESVMPEVWVKNGTVSDSGNQEQVAWLVYEIARMIRTPGL